MPLTTTDLARHLNLPGGAPPTEPGQLIEFQRFLAAAVRWVTRRTGLIDGTATLAVRLRRHHRHLVLPAQQLTAVTALVDPYGATVVPYDVDLGAGILWVPATTAGTWQVTVTGPGWPDDLVLAALEMAKHLYQTQRTTLRPDQDDTAVSTAYSVPNRVLELVAGYTLPGFA